MTGDDARSRLVEPLGFIDDVRDAAAAVAAGVALPLAGQTSAFSLVRLLPGSRLCSVADVPSHWASALERVSAAADTLWPSGVHLMGVLNVTPDSFSDGGEYADAGAAMAAGLRMVAAGASIVDVGGESTRPGARPVPGTRERARVIPVIEGLARQGVTVSVDTRNSETMRAALDVGACIINDVSALTYDPDAAPLVARSDALVVLMHMRGTPETMMERAHYKDVALEVTHELGASLARAEAAGIKRNRIALDPGIGFAKTTDQNVEMLSHFSLLLNLGCPLVVGVSRKRFVGEISGVEAPRERLPGSLAAVLPAVRQGASVLRVHDVAETRQAIQIWRAITERADGSTSR